jgi:PAP_fibrillin
MKTLTVHGFQIAPHHTSLTYGDVMRRTTQASQKKNYRLLASSSELMEPSTTKPTSINVRDADEATTDASSSVRSSDVYIIQKLRQELIELGKRTERGFKASRSDRERAEKLIFDLAQYNPVREPVRTYYGEKHQNKNVDNNDAAAAETTSAPSIQGKWTLIYTDAPDITGLGVPSPFVTLGRIGQDCSNPPYIANVIEWCSPAWANKIPLLVGTNKNTNESARILQKVVTFGSAVPASPMVVDLNVAGLQLSSGTTTTTEVTTSIESNDQNKTSSSNDLSTAIDEDGLIVGVLKQQQKDKPNIDLLKLDESRQPPFGSFEILYLDDTLRITKTSRNHYAINVRIDSTEEEWF